MSRPTFYSCKDSEGVREVDTIITILFFKPCNHAPQTVVVDIYILSYQDVVPLASLMSPPVSTGAVCSKCVGMTLSTSLQSAAVVLCWKTVNCHLRVRNELLHQIKEEVKVEVISYSPVRARWSVGSTGGLVHCQHMGTVMEKKKLRPD